MRALLVQLGLMLPATASAGAWTQPAGDWYTKLWTRSLVGWLAATTDERLAEVEPYQDHALNVYGELGLTDGLTLAVMTSPVGYADSERGALYVGTSWVGLRGALLRGDWRLALEGRAGGSPQAATLGEGGAEGVPWVYVPAVGTGRGDLELQLGRGLGRGWFVATAGLAAFTRADLDPVAQGGAQVGATWSKLQLAATLSVWLPLGPVEATNVSGAGQTAYVGLNPEIAWWFREGWAIGGGLGGALYARSNAATPALQVALHHKGRRQEP